MAIDETVGPIGGQALLEGVMMRRGRSWGAAVRRPDGTIATTSRTLPASLDGWRRYPLVRGVMALGETATLGTRATLWAARERGDEKGDGYSSGGLVLTVAIALIGVFGVFGLLPAVVVKAVGITNPLAFSMTEGLIRLAILVGYLALLGRSPQVRRVFAYHGAEHMTINAYEAGAELTPPSVARFSLLHPRCGTGFLLIVMVVSIFVFSFIGRPNLVWSIVARIVLIPVIAGISYEFIRFSAKRYQTNALVRWLITPSLALQRLTTRPPDAGMLEVAIAALTSVLRAEDRLTVAAPQAAPAAERAAA